jgi:hypothetical protein
MLGTRVVTAKPAVEQSGHRCGPEGPEFKSAQKWNCAARKMIPRSKAQKRARFLILGILPTKGKIMADCLPGQAADDKGFPSPQAFRRQDC